MKITMTAIVERQRARFICKKSKKIAKRFKKKARQFPLRFYIQKAAHLTLRDFHEILEVGIYIEKA